MEDAQKEERRAQPRTKIGLDVLCSSGREEGTAILKHLSVSAALLESATIGPAVGDSVTIWLQAEPDEEPDSVRTEVVRHTLRGFAVVFRVPYSVIRHIIAKYGEAVHAPHACDPRGVFGQLILRGVLDPMLCCGANAMESHHEAA